MKARNSSRNSLHHVYKVLKAGMKHPVPLRDEIYCQLVKQTNNNPSKSALRAWKLFGICTGVFAPSSQLRLPLLNHLITIVENEEEAIAQSARFCANRIENLFENLARMVLPELQEIKHIRHMKPMPVSVFFTTGASVVVLVESYDTASAVKRRLLQKMKMPTHKMQLFGLYEFRQTPYDFGKDYTEERYIWECELIMDILTHWKTYQEESVLRIVLKRRICAPVNVGERDLVSFAYAQASFDVLAGRLPLDRETAARLAVLMLQVDLGEYTDMELISLDEILSDDAAFLMSYHDWTQTLRKSHKQLSGRGKQDCKYEYIQLVSRFPLFSCEHYSVLLLETKGTNRLSVPKTLWLSVNYQGFHLCSIDFSTVYHVFPFADVISWGVGSDRFVLVALFLSDQVEVHLETKQGIVIQQLAEGYANYITGRMTSAISTDARIVRKEGLTRTLVTTFPRLTKSTFKS